MHFQRNQQNAKNSILYNIAVFITLFIKIKYKKFYKKIKCKKLAFYWFVLKFPFKTKLWG